MKRNLLLILFELSSISTFYGQNTESLQGRFYIAPDFGLMFGTINRIEASPALGYQLTDRLSLAAGFKYEYYSETKVYASLIPVKTHIYGPRAFIRYTFFRDLEEFLPIGQNTSLLAHAEFESSSLEKKYFNYSASSENGRFWYGTVLVGGGLTQLASENMCVNIIILLDTAGDYNSLYNNPIIRFGFQYYFKTPEEKLKSNL